MKERLRLDMWMPTIVFATRRYFGWHMISNRCLSCGKEAFGGRVCKACEDEYRQVVIWTWLLVGLGLFVAVQGLMAPAVWGLSLFVSAAIFAAGIWLTVKTTAAYRRYRRDKRGR